MSKLWKEEKGIIISGAVPPLHTDSWVESPVTIQATLVPNNLIQIGAFTGIYGGRLGHCRIGRFCSIAYGVDIASDQHPTNWLSTSMIQYVDNLHGWGDWLKGNGEIYSKPNEHFSSNSIVNIGNDVWIGQGAFIKSGVTIGDGAIVAAHSVVTSDIQPYTIVAGVPARTIKLRFEETLIERMLSVRWWNYNVLSLENIKFSDPWNSITRIESEISKGGIQHLSDEKFSFIMDSES